MLVGRFSFGAPASKSHHHVLHIGESVLDKKKFKHEHKSLQDIETMIVYIDVRNLKLMKRVSAKCL